MIDADYHLLLCFMFSTVEPRSSSKGTWLFSSSQQDRWSDTNLNRLNLQIQKEGSISHDDSFHCYVREIHNTRWSAGEQFCNIYVRDCVCIGSYSSFRRQFSVLSLSLWSSASLSLVSSSALTSTEMQWLFSSCRVSLWALRCFKCLSRASGSSDSATVTPERQDRHEP